MISAKTLRKETIKSQALSKNPKNKYKRTVLQPEKGWYLLETSVQMRIERPGTWAHSWNDMKAAMDSLESYIRNVKSCTKFISKPEKQPIGV